MQDGADTRMKLADFMIAYAISLGFPGDRVLLDHLTGSEARTVREQRSVRGKHMRKTGVESVHYELRPPLKPSALPKFFRERVLDWRPLSAVERQRLIVDHRSAVLVLERGKWGILKISTIRHGPTPSTLIEKVVPMFIPLGCVEKPTPIASYLVEIGMTSTKERPHRTRRDRRAVVTDEDEDDDEGPDAREEPAA
jgi:hypothetical protein